MDKRYKELIVGNLMSKTVFNVEVPVYYWVPTMNSPTYIKLPFSGGMEGIWSVTFVSACHFIPRDFSTYITERYGTKRDDNVEVWEEYKKQIIEKDGEERSKQVY